MPNVMTFLDDQGDTYLMDHVIDEYYKFDPRDIDAAQNQSVKQRSVSRSPENTTTRNKEGMNNMGTNTISEEERLKRMNRRKILPL